MNDAHSVNATPPPELRRAIAQDLRPVRPLRAPARRAIALLPLAPLLLLAAPLTVGVRGDVKTLGFAFSWGFSLAQLALGFVLIGASLKEAVPGRNVRNDWLMGVFAGSIVLVAAITLVTWSFSQTPVELGRVASVWTVCFVCPILTALPAIAGAALLVARAYPVRPRIAGALYGAGAGLMSDAGWRLFCHYTTPSHVFGAHTAAILACAAIGVGVGHLMARPAGTPGATK